MNKTFTASDKNSIEYSGFATGRQLQEVLKATDGIDGVDKAIAMQDVLIQKFVVSINGTTNNLVDRAHDLPAGDFISLTNELAKLLQVGEKLPS